MLKDIIISKAGFPFYTDYWDKYFNKLSGDQVKECLKIIFHYNKTGEILETDDLAIEMVISTIIDNINRDAEKREKQRKASAENGKLGGRPKKGDQEISKTEAKNKQNRSKTEGNVNEECTMYNENVLNVNNNEECKSKNNIILPDYLDLDIWKEYLDMRKKLKAPNTETALNRILKKLEAFEKQKIGNGTLAIENSIENAWKGVFEPKQQNIIKNNSDDSFDRVLKEIQSEQLKLKENDK
jgi:hypothetical protein